MKKSPTAVAFKGTMEQEHQLREVIKKYEGGKGSLLPILQEAQDIYGYLPIEVQKMIATGTGASLEEIYGIVSFYAQFTLNPKGKYAIAVCLGTACYVKGSGEVLERISEKINVEPEGISPDGKYSLEAKRCIGACGLAPVMTANDDVYGRLTNLTLVDKILDKLDKI